MTDVGPGSTRRVRLKKNILTNFCDYIFLKYVTAYGCDTLHRGIFQFVLMGKNSFSVGNHLLKIFTIAI